MADHELAVDAISRQMIELQVTDVVRRSDTNPMPKLVTSQRFDFLATKLAKCSSNSYRERSRDMISFFGCPPIVVAKTWELMHERGTISEKAKDKHLLWGLHYLKEYPGFRVMGATVKLAEERTKPAERSLNKWVWIVIEALADLQDVVILWENRKKNDKGADCLIGVDCKDCKFQQILTRDETGKKKLNKSLYSPKVNGPALRYEIGTSLLSSDIVWLSGPYLPGDYNDIQIFRRGLKHKLVAAGERAEADGGYIGEAPDHIICLQSAEILADEDRQAFNRRAQGRIEVVNRHLTHWKCFAGGKFLAKGTKEEKLEKHRLMFTACVVIKQIGMDLGVGELYKMGDEYK